MKPRKAIPLLAAAFTSVALGFGYRDYSNQIAQTPLYNESGTRPDAAQTAAIVFTGEPVRMRAAIRLYLDGKVSRVFISGTEQTGSVEQLVKSLGLKPQGNTTLQGITLEHKAENTAENATKTALWLRQRGIANAVLVTSDYHMRRSLMNLKAVSEGNVTIYQLPVKTPATTGQLASEEVKSFLTYLGIRGARFQIKGF